MLPRKLHHVPLINLIWVFVDFVAVAAGLEGEAVGEAEVAVHAEAGAIAFGGVVV